MGTGRGGVGISRVLCPIPVPDLQQVEQLVCGVRLVSAKSANHQLVLAVVTEMEVARGHQQVSDGFIVHLLLEGGG